MKTLKLAYPMVFVLAVTLAATGCRSHQPYGVTPIPPEPHPTPMINDLNEAGTLPSNPPVETSSSTGTPTTPLQQFEGMQMDRSALSAYTIHFSFDSAAIRNSDRADLQAVAAILQSKQNDKLLIEGNCDERGTEEYNRALGERRALAARQALVRMGINADRIRTISYGKDKPVDPGHDRAAWAMNRRDDFVLLLPGAGS